MDVDEFFDQAKAIRPTLLTIARRILGDDDEAEDVVQDAMLRLWQLKLSLSTHDDTENLSSSVRNAEAMIKVMVRNLSIDVVRKRKNVVDIAERIVCDENSSDPMDEQLNKVITLMKELPSMQQTVLRLRHFEGMEMADIAQMVGLTEQAVRQSLSRARRTIFNKVKSEN